MQQVALGGLCKNTSVSLTLRLYATEPRTCYC